MTLPKQVAKIAILVLVSPTAAIAQQVNLDLAGEIELTCTFESAGSGNETIDISELGPGQVTVDLEVDCNAPFSYTIESQNGGFLNADALDLSSTGGTALVPYSAIISIDGLTDLGLTAATTDSEEMARANGGFSANSNGAVVFQSGGEMVIEWDTTDISLFAGEYSDVITLSIAGDAASALVN